MAIYAYCLLRLSPAETWPVMRGIGEHPVFPFRSGKYVTLLSRLERSFPFSPRSIVEHGQVIARTFETHTVLPMRFGTFFSSEKQVDQLVRENQRELLETFCRLRGKAEMRLKLIFPGVAGNGSPVKKAPQKVGSWKDSNWAAAPIPMDPRCREVADQLAVWLRETFHPVQDQASCRLLPDGELVVDCAHLIESHEVETCRNLCALLSEQIQDFSLRLSGPWPPYHFLPASVRLPAATVQPMKMRSLALVR